MGMEPFVAADDNAFGHLIGSIPNPIANLQQAIGFRLEAATRGAQVQQAQSEAAEIGQKLSRAQQFQQDFAAAGNDPNARTISALMMKYPDYAEKLKQGWDVKDGAAKTSELTELGEIYSAAASGNWELARKQAQARMEADSAAGQADPSDEQFLKSIDAAAQGDEGQKRAVLTTLGTHIAAVSGPEHFASVYGALKGGFHVIPVGGIATDDEGNIVAHSPLIQGADQSLYDWNAVMGGEAQAGNAPTPPGNITPSAQSVASALSSTGLPAPVVAGFMGNFHAEGGYDGAQGDGGSASGIAQWRGERAANFEKVIGKPVTEATHAEQAQFVAWEMAHPQQAGMTVEQRDAILKARTPAQAAALIDQYYERSSGRDRRARMSAATAFASAANGDTPPHPASGGLKPLLPGKPKPAPAGYQWSADGTQLEKIPGGPADKPSDPTIRAMSDAEKRERGLDQNIDYKINTETGDYNAVGGQQRQAKQIPQGVLTKVQPAIDVRDTMARLASNWKDDYGGHTVLGGGLNTIQGIVDVGPEGMRDWWADFQSMDNIVRNQLFGSALTEHEKQAYAATTITPRMAPDQIRKNLERRRAIINAATARQQNFLKKNGYDPEAVDALFQPLGGSAGGAAAVRVRSIQEAQKLAPGTLFIAPNGKTYRKK